METSADRILELMAETYRGRNAVYGDNWRRVGPVMEAMFAGESLTLSEADDHELFHLFSLIIVKLTRFAVSGLDHQDSIHDAAVYCAMVEAILIERSK